MKALIAALLCLAAADAAAQKHAFATCEHFQAQAMINAVDRIEESLGLGADLECRNPIFNDSTALMQAAGGGAVDAVRLLLKRGAKVNARDKSGWTALRHARLRYDAFVKAGVSPLKHELVMELLKEAGGTE
jgi:ankyrin repeat protein